MTQTTINPIAIVFAAVLSFVAWNSTLAVPHSAPTHPSAQTAPAYI